eukprot:2461992-Alexandrium_andersonii.AAC.1
MALSNSLAKLEKEPKFHTEEAVASAGPLALRSLRRPRPLNELFRAVVALTCGSSSGGGGGTYCLANPKGVQVVS